MIDGKEKELIYHHIDMTLGERRGLRRYPGKRPLGEGSTEESVYSY